MLRRALATLAFVFGAAAASYAQAQPTNVIFISVADLGYGDLSCYGNEYHQTPKLLWGLSAFQNSFGQFSQYAYIGRKFHPWDSHPNLHIKLTGGIVQGYRDPHHDTLPIRWGESWGIGAIPTIGYQKDRFGFDLAFLKESGLLFLAGYHFD